MNTTLTRHATAVLFAVIAHTAQAAGERITIERFQVEGNSLLPAPLVQQTLAPWTGPGKDYGDVQRALESLERAYRSAGYSAVQVFVPEQELVGGVVRLQVLESRLGQATVSGNKYFSDANIRASLPPLQLGAAPNLSALSEAIQLANDNPAKQVEVTLASGAAEDKIDAKIVVVDTSPIHFSVTLDNTGTESSGKLRTGFAVQHANLFDRDHVGTLAFTTSPDSPSDVHVRLYSLGYRVPLYALGDSIDFIYGNSSVNTPGTSPTLGGALGIVGKGSVAGLRFNHFFARQGNYSSKLVFSIDRKYINSRCSNNGVDVSFAPPTPAISACVPYTVMPLGVTYSGRRQAGSSLLDFNAGLFRNLPVGQRYTTDYGLTDRYSYLTPGNRPSRDTFTIARGGATFLHGFDNGWQMRASANLQLADTALVSAEQLGLAGGGSVRGLDERALSADGGLLLNAEVQTPDLAKLLGVPGTLRLLAFQDTGHGVNVHTAGSMVPARLTVASAGLGVRYSAGKDLDFRADAARVLNAGPLPARYHGAWKLHFGLTLGY